MTRAPQQSSESPATGRPATPTAGQPSLTPRDKTVELVGKGPLKSTPPAGAWSVINVGDVITEGLLTIHNTDSEPIVIETIRPVLAGVPIAYLGARLVPPGRKSDVAAVLLGFPPPGFPNAIEPAGATIPPTGRQGYEVLMGFKATTPGRATRRGVTVEYTTRGKRITDTFPITFAVCAPKPATDCEPERDAVGSTS